MTAPRFTRDNRILIAIAVSLGAALASLYALVLKTRALAAQAATNRVVLFVLFYIVILLILTLLFVLGRSAAKLVLETRRGVFGSRFRVRVVVTHVGLALLPIALLLLPTSGLLQRSVERWFRPPVLQTVRAGQEVTEIVRRRAAALERRAADRLAPALIAAGADAERFELLKRTREDLGLDFAEWLPPGGAALAVSAPRWPVRDAKDPGAEWLAEAQARGSARRIEPAGDGGQISRTLVALPGGFLVLGTYDPPDEAGPLRTLARATSTYAALEAERASLEAIEVLLFLLLAFLVLLASVWAGLLLARRVTRPIAALASSARRVAAGDFDAMVDEEGGDEIGALARAFNAMTIDLRKSREGLVAANAELVATNRKLDEQRGRIRGILAHLDAGVVAYSEDGARPLLFANETARRLLGWDAADPATLDELLAGPALAPVREFLSRATDESGPRETTLSLPVGEEPRVLDVRVSRVVTRSGEGAVWVATLEDTTALVKAERAAAWREAAQRMAHEIKNPLTPIRLAAERMRRRARGAAAAEGDALAGVVEEGASTIIEEVTTLSALVDAFGRFARLPAAELSETDLGAVVAQVTKLYAGTKPGVCVAAETGSLPPVRADAEQIKRALINLVDNAVAATAPGGRVILEASVAGGTARVAVSDDGPGLPPAERARVFDPDYSTKSRGTGLGLAIVARIAAEHSGRVFVEENVPKGCRFVLEWPAA